MELNQYSDAQLLSSLKELRKNECHALADIVRFLAEVDSRQVYRDFGYSSLFMFCMKALGYSEGAAQRRITAARCLKNNAEVYEMLRDGKISLCSLSEVAKVITRENKVEVLTLSQGLPRQEAQRLAAQYMPAVAPRKKEVIRAKKVIVNKISREGESTAAVAVTEERFSLSAELDAECMELLKEAKQYSGELKVNELMKVVLRSYLSRKRPKAEKKEKTTVKETTPKSRVLSSSRYIPRRVRDEVRMRDRHCCSFVSKDGVRCSETVGLQYDHVKPFANGGEQTVENLRLVCCSHNQLFAEISFGRNFMESKRK